MRTKKLTVVSFVVLSAIIITGCKPPPVDTNPANTAGKWKAEFTTKTPLVLLKNQKEEMISLERNKDVDVSVEMNLDSSGSATFEADQDDNQNGQAPESITGTWKQLDDFLIIERPNAGFVAFHVSSQSTNQLTVFTRTGETVQFNRIP